MTSPTALTATMRGNDESIGQRDRCAADAALHRPVAPAHFADRRAGAGADVALGHGSIGCGFCRKKPALGIRTDLRIADAKVEENRARHDRNDGTAELEADPLLLEVADDAAPGVETERAAAAQEDRVDLLDGCRRREQIGLPRSRRAAAHVDAGSGALLRDDDGASRSAARSACGARP